MKRFLVLAALVLGLASCQTEPEGLDVQMGGEQEVMLTVSLPETTRANSAQGAFENVDWGTYSLRYILEVYRVNEEGTVLYDNCQRFVETSDATTMVFPVRLAPGYDYRIVAWTDIVEGDSKDDRYYYTEEGLDNVVIKDNGTVNWNAMDETRDAYTAVKVVNDFSSASNLDMELTRPFAKVRVVATDIDDIRNVGLEPTTATVEYSQNMYFKYNAVADIENKGTANDARAKSHTFTYSTTATQYVDNTGEYTLFSDYIFVPSTGTAKFNFVVKDANGGKIKENNFNTDIFVQRNKLTTIKGDVLTIGGNVVVTVEDELGQLKTINYADNAETLQEIINEAPAGEQTNITLGGDIDLGDLLGAGILSTRAAAALPIVIAEGKVVVLDLGGYNITTPWDDEAAQKHYYAFDNKGSLTIQDSKGNGQIIARGIFNYGTMTLESGIINACDGNGGYGVRNYEGAEFVMDGGSIVTSNEDGDIPGEGYDASPVRVDEGATATINGGVINNVSNFTVAIDNYGTTTINDGTFTTIHTTIANSASMTINGGSFTCNGLEGVTAHALWAAAGTTTINGGTFDGKDNYNGFNVDASKGAIVNINGGKFLRVHSGSLYGEGTISVTGGEFFDDPSKFVDDDYKVVENNGVYIVERKDDVAKIGEVGYTSLAKAVAAAQNGETIVFVEDVEQVDGIIITDKNITIDLNDKTFTVSNGANTNNRNFKVNGSSVVTIKNGTMIAAGEYGSGAYGTLRTEGSANVTLEDVKLYNYRGNGLNVKALGGTTVTINDTEIYSQYGGGVEAAGGIVELTNVKIEQKGMYTAPYNSMAISVNGGGVATVNSGTYSTVCLTAEEANNQGTSHGPWCAGVLNSGGTLIIKGGTFSNDNFGDNTLATYARGLLLADTAANIQIEGGTFNAVKAIIDMTNNLGDASRNPSATISGGDFSADPRVSGLYASHLISVADGYKAVEDNGRWAVVVDPVAKIGNEEYASLQEAFNVGGNITLLRDVTVAEPVVLAEGKTAVLDLNGKTLAAADVQSTYAINNLGTLTIKGDGTVNARGIYNGYGNGGNNVTTAKLIIENGTFNAKGTNGGACVYNYGTVDINGGTFESVGGYGLNNQSDAVMTVDNASVRGGIYNSSGCLTVNANVYQHISGRHAIYNWAGSVEVNGGEFDSESGNELILADGQDATVVINDGTFNKTAKSWLFGAATGKNISFVINGGTHNGYVNMPEGTVDTIRPYGDPIAVMGGTFNFNPTTWVADGYKAVQSGDKYVVVANE